MNRDPIWMFIYFILAMFALFIVYRIGMAIAANL